MCRARQQLYYILICSCIIISCSDDEDKLLTVVADSGITFNNQLSYTNELNPYTYRNYYNGAGVGIGDFNSDGLPDIYFTGNQVDNQVYENLGGLEFRAIDSELLSCRGSWSTGVSVLDINSDGLMDIYVCKSGPPDGPRRKNELFINLGNWQFKEAAKEYGLDIKGFSVHASFFDFDKDGDLDCYLLNNSIRSVGAYDLRKGLRDIPSDNGNMLLVNEDGVYVNRSDQLGIYTSDIGFGLGVNTSDINGDGWKDIYVGNDFFERDYLYINQEGQGFKEMGDQYLCGHSMGSMGVDIADINNDGRRDILVAEMAPATIERKKTKATYESWDKYTRATKSGYHYQFGRNMLHLNQGEQLVDVSRMKGLDATEWSWAPLIFDMNNDALKDIFISNGVGKDLLDRDYLAYMANEQRVSQLVAERNGESLKKLIDIMPEQKTMNAFFLQSEGFDFENVAITLTDSPLTFSNGSALSDLDLDGDLDMVISNINDRAMILQNGSQNNYVSIILKDTTNQISTIGTELILYHNQMSQYAESNPFRGFQSTNDQQVIFGVGLTNRVDSVKIIWPDGLVQVEHDVQVNLINTVIKNSSETYLFQSSTTASQVSVDAIDSISYDYPIRTFNEFNKEKLLAYMMPSTGPVFTYLGEDCSSILYGGSQNNQVKKILHFQESGDLVESKHFIESQRAHVIELHSFDSDGDGDLDIYAAHGSRVFSQYSAELDDVLYENKGNGNYQAVDGALPFEERMITSSVKSADLNGDDLEDIIVGEGLHGEVYGQSTRLLYFQNMGSNQFQLKATLSDPTIGMIRDIQIEDIDGDDVQDIIVAGEWMSIGMYNVQQDEFIRHDLSESLDGKPGLWRALSIKDLDGDGDLDIIACNQGLNSFLTDKSRLYINDFDSNGKAEQIWTTNVNGENYPILDYDEITAQIPMLRSVVRSYEEYGNATINDLFDQKLLESSVSRSITELQSGVFFHDQDDFVFVPFPEEIQYSSSHAVEVDDVNGDGVNDILIGGNHYLYKPQFGRDDASVGSLILGKIEDDQYIFTSPVNLNIKGEIREIKKCGANEYWIGVNGQNLVKYKIDYEG